MFFFRVGCSVCLHTTFSFCLGCLFSEDVCIPNVEWCFDGELIWLKIRSKEKIMENCGLLSDLSFGKCLSLVNGLVGADAVREPLSEDQSQSLALMLEELRGAGLGWNHPFVQCRMQAALYSLRQNIPMPDNVCANEVPTRDDVVWLQNPSAVINFAPPNNDYADEVYVPPMKKGFAIEQPYSFEQAAFGPRDQPIAFDDVGDVSADDTDLDGRIQDVKNRIELRKMLILASEGVLKPPIYLKDDIIDADDVYYRDEPAPGDENERYLLSTEKRQQNRPDSDEPKESPLNSLFRENKLPSKYPVAIDPNNEFDRRNNDPTAVHYKSVNANKIPPEAGVYTEGGLVLVPDAQNTNERKL